MKKQNNEGTKTNAVPKTEKDNSKGIPAAASKPEAKKGPISPVPKTVTLAMMSQAYAKKKLAFDKLREGLVKRLDSIKKGMDRMTNTAAQIEAKLTSMVAPDGNKSLIEPLAKSLIALFPGFTYQVTGPVGMLDAITISLIPAGASEEDKVSGKGCKILTILTKTKDGKLCIRDYSKNSGAYLPGSAGFDSGLQYGTIPVPDDATVEFFSKLVK